MNIAKLAVSRPTLVVVVFTVLLFLGFASYKSLNYELMPNFSSPVFMINTVYPGASPSEVENSVTKKMEDAVTTVENVDNIRSTSQEGVSVLVVTLKMDADVNNAVEDAQRKINLIKSNLPKSVLDPMIMKFSTNDIPIMNIGAVSNMSSTNFYDLIKHRVQPELNRIKGVGQISLIGGNEREIKVSLDAKKMETYHLSSMQVLQAIQSSNIELPAGKIKNGDTQFGLRLSAKFKTVQDIANVVISSDSNGSKVYLKDIAEVLDTEKESVMISRINGTNSIGMIIQKQTNANTVEVCHLIREKLKAIESEYTADHLKFEIPMDGSIFTEDAANSVKNDLMYAIILVALVMLVFLHGIRNAIIVMFAIPISLIVSFVGMYAMGYTLNMMTLLAMSLVIGILVDDAIVVLENIYRHLEMGKDRVTATLDGRSEIGFTAVAITMVDVVVFLPIGLSKSIISPILAPYALVIVITTLLSLLVAFTVVPLLTSRFAKYQPLEQFRFGGKFFLWFERLIESFGNMLHNVLLWALRHKLITFGMVTVLFVAVVSLIPAGFVGSEFFSTGDASEFLLQVELPKDATLKETNMKVLDIEHYLYSKKEVKTVFTSVGVGNSGIMSGGEQNSAYKAQINVKLVDPEFRKVSSQIYANQIKNELNSKLSGVKVRTVVINPMMGQADDSPIQVIVKSNEPDSLTKYAKIIRNIIEKTKGTNDVNSSLESVNTEISISIDKDKLASLGLSMEQVGMEMNTAFNGNTDAKFKDGSYEYDIHLIYDEINRKSKSDVANLTFINNAGQTIKLSQFATLTYGNGSTKLERNDRMASITVESQAIGRAAGDVGDEIKEKIAQLKLPSEVSIAYDSDMKYQGDAFGSLGFALITAIFFVYLIMVALYQSYLYPFVVLFTIPLAIIGAILALALAGLNLSIFSMMGLVMLVGLVAKNAILVVDFTNQLRQKGYRAVRALLMATRVRLRPVLMTTISMIVGLMPIAFAKGGISDSLNGIAWVLIGGLTSSMLLTLVIVPLVYLITENIKIKTQELIIKINPKKR